MMMIRPGGVPTETKYHITLGEQQIDESSSEKVLGVNFSNDLKWTSHIRKVKQKVNNGLFTLRRLKTV